MIVYIFSRAHHRALWGPLLPDYFLRQEVESLFQELKLLDKHIWQELNMFCVLRVAKAAWIQEFEDEKIIYQIVEIRKGWEVYNEDFDSLSLHKLPVRSNTFLVGKVIQFEE